MQPLSTRTTLLALLALSSLAAQAQSTTYKIDKMHSEADFSIRHMGISNVHGHFGNISGTVIYDDKDVTKSTVEATIDVTTVDTGVAPRDGHLKSPDFFDVAKYPTMTFKSSSVRKTSDGFDVMGDLTLHGVTKPVTLHVTASKEQTGMDGKSLDRGFDATTTINRQDFGLVWKGPATKTGDAVLGDDVKIEISIEGDRPVS
jgi:polyisoprenoid-binding protein YceI